MSDEDRVIDMLGDTLEDLLGLLEEVGIAAYSGPAEEVLRELATVEAIRRARRVLAQVRSSALRAEQECRAPEGYRFGREARQLSGIDHLIQDDLTAGRGLCGAQLDLRQITAIRLVMPKLCLECARLVGLKLSS